PKRIIFFLPSAPGGEAFGGIDARTAGRDPEEADRPPGAAGLDGGLAPSGVEAALRGEEGAREIGVDGAPRRRLTGSGITYPRHRLAFGPQDGTPRPPRRLPLRLKIRAGFPSALTEKRRVAPPPRGGAPSARFFSQGQGIRAPRYLLGR